MMMKWFLCLCVVFVAGESWLLFPRTAVVATTEQEQHQTQERQQEQQQEQQLHLHLNDPFPFRCIGKTHSEDCIAKDDCSWCQGGSLPGICVSQEESDYFIHNIPGVKCSGTTTTITTTTTRKATSTNNKTSTTSNATATALHKNTVPYDMQCLTAGMSPHSDNDDDQNDDAQTNCDATMDEVGTPCVWCDAAGGVFGLCLSTEQASTVTSYLDCDTTKTTTKTTTNTVTEHEQNNNHKNNDIGKQITSPYDPSCYIQAKRAAAASSSDDEKLACMTQSVDINHDACVWCSYQDRAGLCMNQDQANYVQEWWDCTEPITSPTTTTITTTVTQTKTTTTTDEEEELMWQTNDDDHTTTTTTNVHTDASPMKDPLDITCALAGFSGGPDGESICDSTQDQDGQPCVWCAAEGLPQGLCLTQDQEQIAEQVGIPCGNTNALYEETDVARATMKDPLDVTCALAGFSGGPDGESICDSTQDQDGQPCVWCTAEGFPQGLCLTQDQEQIAEQVGIPCGNTNALYEETDVARATMKDPLDVTCALAGFSGGPDGESICDSTQDQDGQPCVWCAAEGLPQGLCLTQDQEQIAEQVGIPCGNTNALYEETDVARATMKDPLDVTCALAGFSGGPDGESICDSTQDQDGQPCVWCAAEGLPQGLCLTQDQEQIAEQVGIPCGNTNALYEETDVVARATIRDPLDVTCALAGFSGGPDGESICDSTQDQDGQPCVWCAAEGLPQGLCLTQDQEQIAEQVGIPCGSSNALYDETGVVARATIRDPLDVTCALAGFSGGPDGESICDSTQDQDGQPCVWCAAEGLPQGLCLTQDQEQIAEQVGIPCGSSNALYDETDVVARATVRDPLDVTCALAGFSGGPDGESICDSTQDQDGQPCVWCAAEGLPQGLCLTQDQEQIAEQVGIPCGSSNALYDETGVVARATIRDPLDVTCALAGFSGGPDGESICDSTQDQDGQPCVWCAAEGLPQGLCLTQDQEQIAEQVGIPCGRTNALNDETDVVARATMKDPLDVTCALAGFSGGPDGESICESTQDEIGAACVWCAPEGMPQGLCLTQDQEQIAEKVGIECGSASSFEDSQYDMTCTLAGYAAGAGEGESNCRSTIDENGAECAWCTYGGEGLCLTVEQSEIAEQLRFECDDSTFTNPIPPAVKDCLKNVQEVGCNAASDEDGKNCTWCKSVAWFGICLSDRARQIAEDEFGPLFKCDDIVATE